MEGMFGSEPVQVLAGGMRLLRWGGRSDVWILGMFGRACAIGDFWFSQPVPNSGVLLFHKGLLLFSRVVGGCVLS